MTMRAVISSLILVYMCAHANCATVIELSDLVTENELERFSGAMDQYGDIFLQLSRSPCDCKGDKCECCLKKSFKFFGHRYHLSFCLGLQVLEDNKFKIELKEGKHTLYHVTVPLLKKVSECVHIPGVPKKVAKACLELYDIDIKKRQICSKVVLKIPGKSFDLKFGCFHYPAKGEIFLDEQEHIDMESLESRDLY